MQRRNFTDNGCYVVRGTSGWACYASIILEIIGRKKSSVSTVTVRMNEPVFYAVQVYIIDLLRKCSLTNLTIVLD